MEIRTGMNFKAQGLDFKMYMCYFFRTMLREIRIRDFAIIDGVTIRFEPGFNVLTGETGAGKSIVVDALGLTLGDRAQTDMIKSGCSETAVETYFEISGHQTLERLGIPDDEGIIIRRTLLSSGKSKAYINDTMVNLQTISELGRTIVDIHGQHEHQSLLSQENQMDMLDAYGKLIDERSEIERLFHELRSMKDELSSLNSRLKEKGHRTDLLRFQIDEIESAALRIGEKEALAEERAILSNLARLSELTEGAYSLLYSGDGSSSEKLASALKMLKEVSEIDHGIGEILGLLESAIPLIGDAAASLRGYRGRYDADPKRLDAVEDRLDTIERLEKKYRGGIEDILRCREEALKELEGLEYSDEKIKELEHSITEKERMLNELAAKLSAMRKKVSKKIESAVTAVLKELAMEKAEFRIDIKPAPLSSAGADLVEFLFSANKGEQPKPLSRVASGGELSRIMLALKGILAELDNLPVLIFDEVDAGIGGRTAEHVGIRLKNLAKRHQVLCITHLPQIAAMADNHIMIEKAQKKEGVCVKVKSLSIEEREEEIARMLSGKITDISLEHARELLDSGNQRGLSFS